MTPSQLQHQPKLTLALLQILPTGTPEGNLNKGLDYCRQAKAMGADLALFPEMWSTGYSISSDVYTLRTQAHSYDSDFVRRFGELARELDMAIGITFLEAYEPLPRNTLCLYDRFGQLKLHYAKVHTCDFGEECMLTPGDNFPVTDLDTAIGTVRLGAMICYDREFPESARLLMLKGAEIILVPNACPMEINRLSQLRARAFENMVGLATVNYPKGQPDCNGHSSAYDGIAYVPHEPGSRDTQLVEAGEAEGIFLARFDLEALRDYRSREVHGNAYRRPQLYGNLVSETIVEPFIRPHHPRRQPTDYPSVNIRTMLFQDCQVISQAFASQGWNKPVEQYETYFHEQESGLKTVLIAECEGEFAAYATVVWKSWYPYFRDNNIPEIADLNVLIKFRNKGIATRLIQHAESLVAHGHKEIGLGVGIVPAYGPAQRLYAKLGYLPDGLGASVNERYVSYGENLVADDDLIICLTKKLV